MKALAYLLGAQALVVAHDREPRGPIVPEPALPPIATTPETAGAWRRWADAGRTPAAHSARSAQPKPAFATRPAPSRGHG
jgi:hypothetical protein